MPSQDETTTASRHGRDRATALLQRSTSANLTTSRAATADAVQSLGSGSAGLIIAEGDSWFDYSIFSGILDLLEDEHDFDVEEVASAGDTIHEMAYEDGQLARFIRRIQKSLRRGGIPRAILLSGGGNDVAGEKLAAMLNHAASPAPGINEAMLAAVVDDQISLAYTRIISAVTAVCEQLVGYKVPIVLHGYDYPVPDGRGVWFIFGPWLRPSFEQRGYFDVDENTKTMEVIIDRFNLMLARLVDNPDNAHITYVDLRGTLSNAPLTYESSWDNELHPSFSGFRDITARLAQVVNGFPAA